MEGERKEQMGPFAPSLRVNGIRGIGEGLRAGRSGQSVVD